MNQKAQFEPVIVAELVHPGFSIDLSTWEFKIAADGHARQEAQLFIGNSINPEPRIFHELLNKKTVMLLQGLAVQLGFFDFDSEYSVNTEYSCVTDCETTALAFHDGEKLHRVEVYAAWMMAKDGHKEMQKYMRLWKEIRKHLPYRGEY